MLKSNYHSHTYRCGHAEGDVKDRVEEALSLGFHTIGISEHGPQPHLRGNRLSPEDVEEYLEDCSLVQWQYKDQIDVKIGYELEYYPEHKAYYQSLMDDPRCDYMVLGQHFIWKGNDFRWAYMADDDCDFDRYIAEIDEALGTGLFSFIAHPDLIVSGPNLSFETRKRVAHKLLDVLQKHNAIVELNGHGKRSRKAYPIRPFWELVKQRNLRVIINSDAHDYNVMNDVAMQETIKLAEEFDLNVIDKI